MEGFLNVSKKEVKFLMIKTIHSTERFDPYSQLVLGGETCGNISMMCLFIRLVHWRFLDVCRHALGQR